MSSVNKVDLSLDEIIKLNRKEKKQKSAGRGGNNSVRGGGGARGGSSLRGRGRGRGGLGRGGGPGANALRRKADNVTASGNVRRGGVRGRGVRGTRAARGGVRGGVSARGSGRGGVSARGRGRGGVSARGSAGINTTSRGGNLRGRMRGSRGTSGMRGNLRGRGSLRSRGTARGRGGGRSWGQLQQTRQLAMQALQQARRNLANINRQTSRQNFVNARRGISQQGQSLANQNKQFFSSTMSLSSTQSYTPNVNMTSRGRGRKLRRNLEGTKVTMFNPPNSQGNRGRRQWRQQPQTMNKTLTVSIDNIPTASSEPPAQQKRQRRPWRRRRQQLSSNSSSTESSPAPSLSEQIQKLKPTESTKYVFQKKAFSLASTSLSLSERWGTSSGDNEDDMLGRKVFL